MLCWMGAKVLHTLLGETQPGKALQLLFSLCFKVKKSLRLEVSEGENQRF